MSVCAAALVAAALSAAPSAARPEAPLAALGERVIREADFRRHLAETYPPGRVEELGRDRAARQAALEAWLDALALAAKARREGVPAEPRFQRAMALAELKLLSRLLTERHRDRLQRGAEVSPEELRRAYRRHRSELTEEPRFTARQILVYVRGNPAFPETGLGEAEARARAGEALARLRAGEGWETVARSHSDEPGTSQRGGLIRDGRFGHFAPEVERAVREQALGRPGDLFRSAFGYHVLQVEERVTERVARPFEEVKGMLAERIARERAAEAQAAFLAPIREEVGLRLREAAGRDAFLLDGRAVPPEAVLAEVGGEEVRESDFRWFLEDALLPSQRASAYSRPGARRALLAGFLDMLVLAAKARKEGLGASPAFVEGRARMEELLLAEFVQGRDAAGAPGQCGVGGDRLARSAYLERVRAEVGLRVTDLPTQATSGSR